MFVLKSLQYLNLCQGMGNCTMVESYLHSSCYHWTTCSPHDTSTQRGSLSQRICLNTLQFYTSLWK